MPSPYPDAPVASSSRLVSVMAHAEPNYFTTMGTSLTNETTMSVPSSTDRSDNVTGKFYVAKSDDQTQLFNASSSEETNDSEDEAYIVPIKVILHAEHVHQSPSDNETFLKFNYILMRTNDTSYHGHFQTDEKAERLKLITNENGTNIQLNVTNEQDDLISTSSVSPMDVLVNENGDQYNRINEQTIVNEDGVVVGRYNEIAWKRRDYQDITVLPNINENREANADRAMSSESDQENDRHYSQILPWIHFNL